MKYRGLTSQLMSLGWRIGINAEQIQRRVDEIEAELEEVDTAAAIRWAGAGPEASTPEALAQMKGKE